MTAIEAVLLDVGGTLWPNRLTHARDPMVAAAARLSAQLGLDSGDATALVAWLVDGDGGAAGGRQDTDGFITTVLDAIGWAARSLDVRAIRRAMCQPAAEVLRLFPDASELLTRLSKLDLRVAIVSNAVWRDAEAYEKDFRDLGLSDLVDAYVSSVDVGYRKPHAAMFQAAIAALRADPKRTVMVGDSVANDIVPAAALGMRTVLVAIEADQPADSPGDALCTSLAEVQRWLGLTCTRL